MEDLKVTIIQFDIVWEDKQANFDQLESQFLAKLGEGDTDLIVLPEMFATGFTMKPADYFENRNGLTFKWLEKWASKLKCSIAAGLITKSSESQYQNTFILVRPTGTIETYHKRHLFRMGEENKHYVGGIHPKIIELKGWKINLQICYDLRFPAFARNKMQGGKPSYDAMIYIANWPEVRTYAWSNLLQARAIENQAYIIGVNRVGGDRNGISHSGESAIIGPAGLPIIKPIMNSELMVTASMSFEHLKKARTVFPVLLDADRLNITD